MVTWGCCGRARGRSWAGRSAGIAVGGGRWPAPWRRRIRIPHDQALARPAVRRIAAPASGQTAAEHPRLASDPAHPDSYDQAPVCGPASAEHPRHSQVQFPIRKIFLF